MKAILDCNSFYCSCERLFRPALLRQPVVVLSNNDGCIISRTDEAKALGVPMGQPYFQAKDIILQEKIATFSSNYNLYGDLSWRVMETLRQLLPPEKVEVYSVDECFLDLDHIAPAQLHDFCAHLKATVEQWTGIAVSVGAAPTKVLSKVANRLAKKDKAATGCIMVLDSPEKTAAALRATPVEDLWGVGRQYALKLRQRGIFTGWDLRQLNLNWIQKEMGGVVGVRLVRELRGEACIDLKDPLTVKKMIATTRMFGVNVTLKKEIKEAVATYVTRAAEKLRRQDSAASLLEVFLIAKAEEPPPGKRFRHGPHIGGCVELPQATDHTPDLITAALDLVDQLFEAGRTYKKAGVMLGGLVPVGSVQTALFAPPKATPTKQQRQLMAAVDNINFALRNDVLQFAAAGNGRRWKMRQEHRSPRYTSRWDEICEVK